MSRVLTLCLILTISHGFKFKTRRLVAIATFPSKTIDTKLIVPVCVPVVKQIFGPNEPLQGALPIDYNEVEYPGMAITQSIAFNTVPLNMDIMQPRQRQLILSIVSNAPVKEYALESMEDPDDDALALLPKEHYPLPYCSAQIIMDQLLFTVIKNLTVAHPTPGQAVYASIMAVLMTVAKKVAQGGNYLSAYDSETATQILQDPEEIRDSVLQFLNGLYTVNAPVRDFVYKTLNNTNGLTKGTTTGLELAACDDAVDMVLSNNPLYHGATVLFIEHVKLIKAYDALSASIQDAAKRISEKKYFQSSKVKLRPLILQLAASMKLPTSKYLPFACEWTQARRWANMLK